MRDEQQFFFLSAADEKNVELFAITQQQQFRMRKKNRETGEKSEIDYIICAQFFADRKKEFGAENLMDHYFDGFDFHFDTEINAIHQRLCGKK